MDNKWLSESYTGLLKNIETITDLSLKESIDLEDNIKSDRLLNFYECLENKDVFSLFIDCKIKVFSAKTIETNSLSKSLFDDKDSLKQILNKKDQFIKNKIWSSLLNIYHELEENREKLNMTTRTERLELIQVKLEELNKYISSKVKNNILNTEVNNTTNNMIDDIVGSFQNVMNKNANPFDNIMDITNKITEKYHNKIQNGEIELDKIMGNLQDSLPNMGGLNKKEDDEEKVIIDEEFSTADVEVNKEKPSDDSQFNIGNMMKTAKNIPDISKLTSMVGKLNDIKDEKDAGELKSEMDSFLSSSLGIDVNELNKNMEMLQKKLETQN